jgi:hypothetical protein
MNITPLKLAARICGLVLLGWLPAAAAPAASDPASEPPVTMQKYVVNDKHLLCFGLAIELWEDKNTQRVLAMYVKAVQPESMAELEGLAPGTRIFGIEGIPVEDFQATFGEGSELNKIFLNRKNGDRVTLEIKLQDRRGTKFVTLVQRTGLNVSLGQSHDR